MSVIKTLGSFDLSFAPGADRASRLGIPFIHYLAALRCRQWYSCMSSENLWSHSPIFVIVMLLSVKRKF